MVNEVELSDGDPSGWLGGTTWIAAATVSDTGSGQSSGSLELRLSDVKVLSAYPVYYWLGEYRTPSLDDFHPLWVELTIRSARHDYRSMRVHLVLQATGAPEELVSGRRVDGALAISVLMILDEQWTLLEAGGGYTEVYTELLELYGEPGQGTVEALIADARPGIEWANRPGAPNPEGQDEPRPPTRGPLGEWRRAQGYETTNEPTYEIEIAEWFGRHPDERQLPTTEGEYPPEFPAMLGTDPLLSWQLNVVASSEWRATHPWVALRFRDVGIIGPFSTGLDDLIPISGLGPDSTGEFIAWTSLDFDLGNPDLVQPLDANWRPPEVGVLDFRGDPPSFFTQTESEAAKWKP
jgi:hypothetical protein